MNSTCEDVSSKPQRELLLAGFTLKSMLLARLNWNHATVMGLRVFYTDNKMIHPLAFRGGREASEDATAMRRSVSFCSDDKRVEPKKIKFIAMHGRA